MEPHAFFQQLLDDGLEERHCRGDARAVGTGVVEQAVYLERWSSFWSRWLPWRAAESALRVKAPFDAHGRDVLGLMATPLQPAEGGEGMARYTGLVRSIDGSKGEVFRDLWVQEPTFWRLCQGVDFVLDRAGESPVLVSFGLAPLVVSLPVRVQVREELRRFADRTLTLKPSHLAGEAGALVTLSVGDEVEVRGVSKGLERSRRVFDASGWQSAYRGEPGPIHVIGDEDGTRLVIHRTRRLRRN